MRRLGECLPTVPSSVRSRLDFNASRTRIAVSLRDPMGSEGLVEAQLHGVAAGRLDGGHDIGGCHLDGNRCVHC